MSAFAPKPKATQQAATANAPLSAQDHFEHRCDLPSAFHLQRTVGNQAVQRLLRTKQDLPYGVTDDHQSRILQAAPDPAAPAAGPSDQLTKVEAAIGASAKFYYLAADTQGNALFILFDNPEVQRFYRSLLNQWFGVDGPNSALEDTPNQSTPPKWVGEFRAKALNIAPKTTGDEKKQADLAINLANSVAAESPAQRLRRMFVEEADKRIGTTVMTQAEIDTQRAQPASAGLTPQNFTTCIAFFGQVIQQITSKSKITGSLLDGPNAYKEINPQAKKELPKGAWHACTPGGTDRPKPGDLLIFTFAENVMNKDGTLKFGKGYFAHITIFRSNQPLDDSPEDKAANGLTKEFPESKIEKWLSIDGGGTTAGLTTRYFCADKCRIAGRGEKRTLHGWIDIEQAAEPALQKAQTT